MGHPSATTTDRDVGARGCALDRRSTLRRLQTEVYGAHGRAPDRPLDEVATVRERGQDFGTQAARRWTADRPFTQQGEELADIPSLASAVGAIRHMSAKSDQ